MNANKIDVSIPYFLQSTTQTMEDTMPLDIYSEISDSSDSSKSSDSSESSDETSSDSSGNESKKSESKRKKSVQKRASESESAKTTSAKKICGETDFETVSELLKSGVARGLQILKQENDENIGKANKVQRNLEKVSNEKRLLERKLLTLNKDKKAFEKVIADMKETRRKEKETFDNIRKELMENLATSEMAHLNEKKKFDEEKTALKQRVQGIGTE